MRSLCFNRKYHKMAVRRELVIDEWAALRAAADKLTPF